MSPNGSAGGPPAGGGHAGGARAGGRSSAEPDEGIDVREYLGLVLNYKWLILGITVLVSAGVIFWTLRQPKVYRATCSIEYDPNPVRPLGSGVEDVAEPMSSFWMNQEFFATQNRIISSRTVLERVVERLSLNQDPSFFYVPEEERGDWRETDVTTAARTLMGRLTIEPVENTRLVAIQVEDRDPERAASLANAIADAYIEKTLEDRMGSTVSALEWLGNQLDTLRRELESSELALHRFKREHNVLSLSMEDRQNLVASEIESFSEALTKARTRRIELSAHHARLREASRLDVLDIPVSMFPDEEGIRQLRAALRNKMAEREGFSTRYGPNHPQMVTLNREIEMLRSQLRQEFDAVVRAAVAEVAEVQQSESGFRSALDHAHQNGLELNLREIEYQRLNRERENNVKIYNVVLQRTTETDLTRMLHTTHARILDRAVAPTAHISPKFPVNAAFGLGAGLALALAIAFMLSRLDRRIKSVEDAEVLGLTILGILPRIEGAQDPRDKKRRRRPLAMGDNRDLIAFSQPRSAAAECCRTIRTNLTFVSASEPLRSLVVTSAHPREGKTTVTTNLAISLAQSGKKVLLVDTDLRRPRVHRSFGVSGKKGVTTYLVGETSLKEAVSSTKIPDLDILACGPIPPNPAELLHGAKFAQLVKEALAQYDRVIFDSPPLGAVTDAAVLSTQLDGTLLVVKADRTTRDALRSALRQLHDVSANVVGGVLNDVDPKQRGYGYYYYYYRNEGYYTTPEEMDEGNDPPSGAAAESARS